MDRADPAVLVLDAPRDAQAAARSRIYALLGEAFSYPAGAVAARLGDGTLLAELQTAAAALVEPPAVPAPPGADDTGGDLQIIHTGLFDVGAGRPQISLLERSYGARDEPEQALWEDLLRFYRFFGLDFSKASPAEPPDHLLTELDFMHYLCFLEAGAQRGRDDLRRGQRDFLDKHLARWTAPLAAALADVADSSPYAALGALLDAVVRIDLGE